MNPFTGTHRGSRSEVFCRKAVLYIFGKFLEKHPWRSAILVKLQTQKKAWNFTKRALSHGCSLWPIRRFSEQLFCRTPTYQRFCWNNPNTQPIFQRRINFVSTFWINVKVTLIRRLKWNRIRRSILNVAERWYNFILTLLQRVFNISKS